MKRRKRAAVVGFLVLALTGGWFLFGLSCVDFGSAPSSFDAEEQLGSLLGEALHDGLVDYESVRAFGDGSGVDELAAFYAREQPRDGNAGLAAAINAYNVTVLALVARRRPQRSIHEVRGAIEPTPGFGFFYALWFQYSGSWTNLYDLENDVIRAFGDPRIHAAINCASTSCPSLYEHPFRAEELDSQLDEVSRRFVSDLRHVRYDDGTLHLSSIFDWFAADFEAYRGSDGAQGLRAFIRSYCGSPSCEAPDDATLQYNDYDWSLNTSE